MAIRVENATNRTFDAVWVGFPEQREVYGRVSARSVSAYRAVGTAYRYAYVEIRLGVEKAVIQPMDYLGETPWEPGRYTYRMTLNPNSTSPYDRVLLELVVDS